MYGSCHKSIILIPLDFVSGVEWLCQPDRTPERKKSITLKMEKPDRDKFISGPACFLSGVWWLSLSQKKSIFSTFIVLIDDWLFTGEY